MALGTGVTGSVSDEAEEGRAQANKRALTASAVVTRLTAQIRGTRLPDI